MNMRKYTRDIFAYSLFIHFLTNIYNGKYIRNKTNLPLEILNVTDTASQRGASMGEFYHPFDRPLYRIVITLYPKAEKCTIIKLKFAE